MVLQLDIKNPWDVSIGTIEHKMKLVVKDTSYLTGSNGLELSTESADDFGQ